MAVKKGKTRISITLGDTVLEKLDKYCEQSGLTRSAVIGDIVGTNLGVFERFATTFEKELASALASAQRDTGE